MTVADLFGICDYTRIDMMMQEYAKSVFIAISPFQDNLAMVIEKVAAELVSLPEYQDVVAEKVQVQPFYYWFLIRFFYYKFVRYLYFSSLSKHYFRK